MISTPTLAAVTAPDLAALRATAEAEGITRMVVAAVTRDGDRTLLLRRTGDDFMPGLWELPSGNVDPGEDLDTALIREVAEETGLTVTALTSYLGSFDYTSGSGAATRQFTFAVAAEVAEVALTEHDAYMWADTDGLPAVSDQVKAILQHR